MSDVPSFSITYTFNGDVSASNRVNAAALDAQLGNIATAQNQTKAALDRITDGSNDLAASTVGMSQLKSEVLNLIGETITGGPFVIVKSSDLTLNVIPVATGAGSLANSHLSDTGTLLAATVPISVSPGLVSAPGLCLGASTGTGWYQPSANTWEWSGSGVGRVRFATSGANIYSLSATTIASLATSGFSNTAINAHGADSTLVNIAAMSYNADVNFIGRVSGGAGATPAATPSGQQVGYVLRGHTGAAFTTVDRAGIFFLTTELWSAGANGARAQIKVTRTGTTTTVVGLEVTDAQRVITNAGSAPAANSFVGHLIYGVTDATAPVAGQLGEIVESKISSATNAAGTGAYLALTSISLGAGDWDIEAYAEQVLNAATLTANGAVEALVGTTSASNAGTTAGYDRCTSVSPAVGTISAPIRTNRVRVQITATTVYYLNVLATFTVGTPQWRGSISARRIR